MTDTGVNLLEPGSNPAENRIFMLMILAVIAGVDEYADLVRMSAASAGNDNRLGGNEAPPSIISVFVGNDLYSAFETLKEGKTAVTKVKEYIKMGLPSFPKLKRITPTETAPRRLRSRGTSLNSAWSEAARRLRRP